MSAQMKYCVSHIQKATPAAIATGVLFPLISHCYSLPVYYKTMKGMQLMMEAFMERIETKVCQVLEQ